MDREQFEKLINEWLDEPDSAERKAAVAAAAARDPALAALRDAYLRLGGHLPNAERELRKLDWALIARRIAAAVRASDGAPDVPSPPHTRKR